MVVVHDAELLGETNDAASTATLQLITQALEKILTGSTTTSWGSANFPLEDLAGKFTVVKRSTAILVVDVVEGVQILSCGDHDTDLLDSLGELIWLDSAVIIQIEVFEGLQEDGLFVGCTCGLGRKFSLKTLFKAVDPLRNCVSIIGE